MLLIVVVLLSSDVLRLNPAQQVAISHLYNLPAWEIQNLFDKWVHKVLSGLPWIESSSMGHSELIQRYFDLGLQSKTLASEISEAKVRGKGLSAEIDKLATVKLERLKLRDQVEEVLEATISEVIIAEGLGTIGEFIWPPVDVRLTAPPLLLITSPRDRIERTHEALLVPKIEIRNKEFIEKSLLHDYDLAALVVQIGGIATVPASIPDTLSLQDTLQSASHEWVHHYLTLRLRPLGIKMFSSPEMLSLNETFADMVSREIRDQALVSLGEEFIKQSLGPGGVSELSDVDFRFHSEMRVTRVRVDKLLGEGKVEEAEQYMEKRRLEFNENGVHIRKINQAFFAFYGTYAGRPESVSPIGIQLKEFRFLLSDLGTFVEKISGYGSYGHFLEGLENVKDSKAETEK